MRLGSRRGGARSVSIAVTGATSNQFRTLAQVRRLVGLTIQVNIAEKQVNVAG